MVNTPARRSTEYMLGRIADEAIAGVDIAHEDVRREPGARRIPDGEGVGAAVAPDKVALVVAVEIADAGKAPAGSDRTHIDVRGEAGAGRLPFRERVAVLPDQVALAVAVEIAF